MVLLGEDHEPLFIEVIVDALNKDFGTPRCGVPLAFLAEIRKRVGF
jgi:hypothetical protein